jgi:protein tyrosine phosphatase
MEDYQEIIPHIFLGGSDGAKDSSFIKNKHISIIVNCTKDIPHHFEPLFLEPIQNAPSHVQEWIYQHIPTYYRIPVDDNMKDSEINRFYDYSIEFIPTILKHYQEGKNIFIHCLAGAQRSAGFVAILLMNILQINMKEAIDRIVQKRRQAFCFGTQVNFSQAIQKYSQL